MLQVFFGEDRLTAEREIQQQLGKNYEVFEGETLHIDDLPSIFQGTSLFSTTKRQILLKNLSENTAVWEKVVDYLTTEHTVIIWEGKIDKRSAGYKALKAAKVPLKEFPLQVPPETKQVFKIFDLAWNNGPAALGLLQKIEAQQDPYMFFGLLVTQALRRFEQRPRSKERAVLKALAKTDLALKTTSLEPWLLVKSFLLQLSTLD